MNKDVIAGGAIATSLIALSKAIITLGFTLGWWNETVGNAWATFADAAIPILVTLGTMLWLSRRTTSLKDAKDTDGVKLVREDNGKPTLYKQKVDLERSIQR